MPNVILIVCNRVPYPLKDGGALAMYAMIKGWHEAGRQVHVLAMNTSRHKVTETELPDLFRQIASFGMVAVDTEIHVLSVLRNLLLSNKPEHAERFYIPAFARKLVSVIQQAKPDIIQLESIYLHEYNRDIREHSKATLLQRLHNIEGDIWRRLADGAGDRIKQYYLRILARRITKYEQRVWKESDALIAISEKDLAVIRKNTAETPAICIPYGIEQTETSPSTPGGPWIAYHIGAMDWQPNIEAMEWMRSAIVPEIIKQVPGFAFHFAGRKMPQPFLSEQQTHFYCDGEVPDAARFLADKRILIVPLRSGSGIRVKTLEAMAAGKLVISTRIGMEGIEAIDHIHYLQADTPQQFAEAVAWVTAHPAQAEKMIRNASELVTSNHDQGILMKRLEDFVEKLS